MKNDGWITLDDFDDISVTFYTSKKDRIGYNAFARPENHEEATILLNKAKLFGKRKSLGISKSNIADLAFKES